MGDIWKGEKIRLRPIDIKDMDDYFDIEDIDTDIQRAVDSVSFPETKEKLKERLEKMIQKMPEKDAYWWIIEDHQGNPVGDISTFGCSRRNGTFKYGLMIKKPYWGKGYATETIKIVVGFYFRELRYQKATIYAYSFNDKSIGLHKKLGFKEEGRLRRMLYTNGEYYDEVHLGITKEEFHFIDEKSEL